MNFKWKMRCGKGFIQSRHYLLNNNARRWSSSQDATVTNKAGGDRGRRRLPDDGLVLSDFVNGGGMFDAKQNYLVFM